jgi:hypothetical protein
MSLLEEILSLEAFANDCTMRSIICQAREQGFLHRPMHVALFEAVSFLLTTGLPLRTGSI